MKRTRIILLAMATIAAMVAAAAPSGAATSQPTPRWVLHTQRFPGGISNGVRAMVARPPWPPRPGTYERAALPPHRPCRTSR